jgi:hypothetical protein
MIIENLVKKITGEIPATEDELRFLADAEKMELKNKPKFKSSTMSKVATTTTAKFNNASCNKCVHYWLRGDKETCTNEEVNLYYANKMKINSMCVCDFYDSVE